MTKICTKCKKELDISMFSKNKNTKDGLCTQCKICTKKYREEAKNSIDEYKDFYGKHKIIEDVEYKFCSCCHSWLPLDNFSLRKDSKDGLRDQCISCRRLQYTKWANKNLEQNTVSKNNITHKICTHCKQDKDISNFNKCLTNPDGYQYICIDCRKIYRQTNQEHIREASKIYREQPEVKEYMRKYLTEYYSKPENVERRNKNSNRWYRENKDKVKQYYENNKKSILEKAKEYGKLYRQSEKYNSTEEIKKRQQYHKEWYNRYYKERILKQKAYKEYMSTPEYKEELRQKARERYYSIPVEERQQKARNYRQKNLEKIKEADKIRYEKNKLNRNMSRRLYVSLKGNKSERHWETLVSYTLKELKEHLEKQFDENMNWENYGSYWEIDHIIPQNQFDIQTENDADFKICWSLANLRPLEKSLNRQRPKDGSDISEDQRQKILKGVK